VASINRKGCLSSRIRQRRRLVKSCVDRLEADCRWPRFKYLGTEGTVGGRCWNRLKALRGRVDAFVQGKVAERKAGTSARSRVSYDLIWAPYPKKTPDLTRKTVGKISWCIQGGPNLVKFCRKKP